MIDKRRSRKSKSDIAETSSTESINLRTAIMRNKRKKPKPERKVLMYPGKPVRERSQASSVATRDLDPSIHSSSGRQERGQRSSYFVANPGGSRDTFSASSFENQGYATRKQGANYIRSTSIKRAEKPPLFQRLRSYKSSSKKAMKENSHRLRGDSMLDSDYGESSGIIADLTMNTSRSAQRGMSTSRQGDIEERENEDHPRSDLEKKLYQLNMTDTRQDQDYSLDEDTAGQELILTVTNDFKDEREELTSDFSHESPGQENVAATAKRISWIDTGSIEEKKQYEDTTSPQPQSSSYFPYSSAFFQRTRNASAIWSSAPKVSEKQQHIIEPTVQEYRVISATTSKQSRSSKVGVCFKQRKEDGAVAISRITDSSPFLQSKLKIGDIVVRINDVDCEGFSAKQVADLVRNARGNVEIAVVQQKSAAVVVGNARPYFSVTVHQDKRSSRPGVGIISDNTGRVMVSSIDEDSLFAQTVLQPGDEIISINSVKCREMNAKGVENLLKVTEGAITLWGRKKRNFSSQIMGNPTSATEELDPREASDNGQRVEEDDVNNRRPSSIEKPTSPTDVGLKIESNEDGRVIVTKIKKDERSPLSSLALQAGDEILSVNGVRCQGLDVKEVAQLFNESNGAVSIVAKREDSDGVSYVATTEENVSVAGPYGSRAVNRNATRNEEADVNLPQYGCLSCIIIKNNENDSVSENPDPSVVTGVGCCDLFFGRANDPSSRRYQGSGYRAGSTFSVSSEYTSLYSLPAARRIDEFGAGLLASCNSGAKDNRSTSIEV